jgi:hypothetical protein
MSGVGPSGLVAGGGIAAGGAAVGKAAGAVLPFTGIVVGLYVAVGALLIIGGFALRKLAAKRG